MRSRIQKWGHGLALRIPKSMSAKAQLTDGMLVNLSVVDGKMVVCPIKRPHYSLEELLAQVTDENIHLEIDFGPDVGKEAW